MTLITDYASLQAVIADTLNRSDLTEQIPTFIQLAEAMFIREIRYRKIQATDTEDTPTIQEELPSDFLELVSIRLLTDPPCVPNAATPDELAEFMNNYVPSLWPPGYTPETDNGESYGVPPIYTIVGTQIWWPWTPPVSVEITSYIRLPVLADDNPTNDLLLDYPDIYLFGSLIQAEAYLKNDPRLATWGQLYEAAKQGLKQADERARRAPSPLIQRSGRTF